MSVVSNTSPLISLASIRQLDLLKTLYGTIHISNAVYREVVTQGGDRPGAKEVARASWIKRHQVRNRQAVKQLLAVSALQLGESETIILAHELKAEFVILDERPARREAAARKLPVIGTASILLVAKAQGLIPTVKPQLDALMTAGLRIHPLLYQAILQDAGES